MQVTQQKSIQPLSSSNEFNSKQKKKPPLNKIKFTPIKYIKLSQIFAQITQNQLRQSEQSMLPINFAQLHQKQLKTYLFQIQIQDQYKKWRIIKRLSQLIQLYQHLQKKYPNKKQIFPIPHLQQKQIQKKLFGTFLNSIVEVEDIKKDKNFLIFIENYIPDNKKKVKTYLQRTLNKKAGGRHTQSNLTKIWYNLISWRHKFFTITKQGVYYTDNQQSFQIQQIILFNQQFSMLHGQIKTGYTYGIVINSSHRVLQIDAQNIFDFLFFIFFVQMARQENQENQMNRMNRFNSFAKIRQGKNCQAEFYIDGEMYFKAVYAELLKAKKEVFITGWFVAPFVYLAQNYQNQQYRLDRVLTKIAENGVKIYIIIYNAPTIALYINPEFIQTYLSSLHVNIKILKHPNFIFIPFLWSHHQKLVIIDQKVGFLGGLDLAYGRIDNSSHLLNDQSQILWKGVQYCNFRIVDISQPHNFQKCSINRKKQPRMPWHDVGVKIIGSAVLDLCVHFTQYWNHVNFQMYMNQRELIMYTGIHQEQLEEELNEFIENDGEQNSLESQFQRKQIKEQKEQRQSHVFNFLRNIAQKSGKTSSFSVIIPNKMDNSPQLNRLKSTIFELSDNDDQDKKNTQKNYYLSYIKQNFNSPRKSSKNIENAKKSFILSPKKRQTTSKTMPKITEQLFVRSVTSQNQMTENFNLTQDTQKIMVQTPDQKQNKKISTHQILRSASLWSLGLEQGKQQHSIMQAYCSLIQNAKKSIYIQNQFFMSVQNLISQKIIDRINLAYEKKQQFKVLIIIPFLPGFQGQIQNQSSSVIRTQLSLINKTLSQGPTSILSKLSHLGSNLPQYLSIFCPRTHTLLNSTPVTQIIYIHSKIIIIDDEISLIGSANINDRSMLGTRDSQIGVILEDERFSLKLRKKLCEEHFGLLQDEAEKIWQKKCWEMIQFNAQRNQKIYRKIFGCYPDNMMRKFEDIQKIKEQAQIERYEQLIQLIKGYACPFQGQFLCEENLQLKSHHKEYYVPFINFT